MTNPAASPDDRTPFDYHECPVNNLCPKCENYRLNQRLYMLEKAIAKLQARLAHKDAAIERLKQKLKRDRKQRFRRRLR